MAGVGRRDDAVDLQRAFAVDRHLGAGGHVAAEAVRLRQAAPTVECKVVPGVSLELLSQVDAAELDSAIIIRPPFDLPKELYVQVLRKEPFVLVVPNTMAGDDPLQLLNTQPHVRYDRASFGGRLVSRFLREQKLDVQVALELDELEAIVRMVECGLGVSLIPKAGLWLERSPQVRIIPLGKLTFYREIILLSRYSQRHLPVPQLFARCLLADPSL